MRRSEFTDEEIIGLLRDAEAGTPVSQICRMAAVSPRTFYRWRQRFGGLEPTSMAEMRALQIENRRLRSVLDDLLGVSNADRPRSPDQHPTSPPNQTEPRPAPGPRSAMTYFASLRVRP